MAIKQIKYELQNILSGKSGQSYDAIIQAISCYLRESKSTSTLVKNQLENKSEEKKRLIKYAEKVKLIFNDIDEKDFISEGSEQKVFIKGLDYVLKLNDAIYYES